MIDIHSHILPGVDDGPDLMSESIEMARLAVSRGTTEIVATPHFADGYPFNRELIYSALSSLRDELKSNNIELTVHYGLEVQLNTGLFKALEEIDRKDLTVANNSKYMLVELPFYDIPEYIDELIETIVKMDLIPVVVHPLRNARIMENLNTIDHLAARGCLFQINKEAVLNAYPVKTLSVVKTLIASNKIHFIASDSHSSKKNMRRPTLDMPYKKIESICGSDTAEILFKVNPRRIINGILVEDLPLQTPGLFDRIMHIFKD